MTRLLFAFTLCLSALCGTAFAQALDTRPSTPGNPSARAYGPTSGGVAWQRSTDDRRVVGYEITRDGTVLGVRDTLSYVADDLAPGRGYNFAIVAIDSAGQRSGRALARIETPDARPNVPSGLSARVYSTTAAGITWERSGVFGERYEVKRDGRIVAAATNGTSYIDQTLSGRRPYLFEVIAVNRQGQRSAAARLFVRTADGSNPSPVSAPAAPSGLRSIVYSSTAGAIAWDRASAAGLRYEVSRGGEIVATTDGTSYVDRTLEGGRTYPYSVIAIDRQGRRSSPSRIGLRTNGSSPSPPPVADGPRPPAELTAEVRSEREVRLEWRREQAELDFRYEVRLDGEVIDTVGPNIGFLFGFSINTLVAGTDYAFEVIAIDTDGRRSAPSSIEVRTDGETPTPGSAPPAPANLRVEVYRPTPGTPRQAALFWDRAATPGLRYEVQRNGFVFETTRRTSYYFEWSAGGNDFTFDIVAFDGDRQSPPASVTVRFPPRTSLPDRPDEPDAIDLASDRFAPDRGFFVTPPAFATRALGDVDGDGLADVLFTEVEGDAFVVPGRARGVTELDPRETSTTGGYRVPPSASQALAGGDFNGDGIADLIGAEPDETVGGSERAGRVWVLYGQRGGLADYESVDDIGPGEGAVFSGFAPDQAVGSVVSGIGDLDGDGFDDFAMLADPTFFPDRGGPGGLYVVYGSDALPGSVPLGQIDSVGELISAPEVVADELNSNFIYSAQIDDFVPVGDVNGDGLADLAIVYTAMPRDAFSNPLVRVNQTTLLVLYGRADRRLALPTVTDPVAPERGYRLIDAPRFSTTFFPSDGILGAGDVDGDGTDDILVQGYGLVLGSTEPGPSSASTIDDLPESRLRPVSGLDDPEGPSRLYPIGDANGDGRADLHTRDIKVRAAEDETGYVVLDAFATADPLSLGNLRAQPGFPLVLTGGNRARAVAIGDFDGDGVDDFYLQRVFSGGAGTIVYGSRDFR